MSQADLIPNAAVACSNPSVDLDWSHELPPSASATSSAALYWAAVQVRPNHEHTTVAFFGLEGFEYYLPLYKTVRQWSDRRKELELPLFPGYVFCRYSFGIRGKIYATPGVLRIVSTGLHPVPVSDGEIAAVKRLVASNLNIYSTPYIQTGDRVRVNTGPLKGLEGIVTGGREHKCRFVVSMDLMQRSVGVELDSDLLSPLAKAAPSAVR